MGVLHLMLRAIPQGLKSALGRPAILVAAWLLTFAFALPDALGLREQLHDSFGRTQIAERMEQGFDVGWYGDFSENAQGAAKTFDPTGAGVGGVLSNVESWITGGMTKGFAGFALLGVLFAIVWAYFLAGAVEAFVFPDGPRGPSALLSACGRHGFRFVRLALVSAVAYYLIYRFHGWRMDLLEKRLLDVTEETWAMYSTIAAYLFTAVLLIAVRTISDYAKIALVREETSSALVAALRGAKFVVRHPLRCAAPVLAFLLLGAVLLAGFVWLRPSTATPGTIGIALVVLAGQAWVFLRLSLRLSLLGAEANVYESVRSSSLGK